MFGPNRDYELSSDRVGTARTSAPNTSAAVAPDSKTVAHFQCDFIGASLCVPPPLGFVVGADVADPFYTRLSSAM